MKPWLWILACTCLTACVMEDPGDIVVEDDISLEVESALEPREDLDLAAASDVEATSSASEGDAVWRPEAAFAACHGTVTCPAIGTPSNWSMLYCGADRCINQICQVQCPTCEPKAVREQPREQRRYWSSNGILLCTEYRPYNPYLTCTCEI